MEHPPTKSSSDKLGVDQTKYSRPFYFMGRYLGIPIRPWVDAAVEWTKILSCDWEA
jgi:hypothetical protein